MSIMDFFSSQGTAVPSTGSSGGGWEDWFLDMENRAPFGGGTAYPDPEAERGDWIDWYLNREGPAGRFRGSRRPRYGIDYLFNGGGSVRSKPRSSPGPKTRQKLQPRGIEAIVNSVQNRQNTEQRRWEGAGGEGPYPVWNQPNPDSRQHTLDDMSSGWLEANTGPWYGTTENDNSGIISAATDYSPDGQGRWMFGSPWGQKLLGYAANEWATPESVEYLQDAIEGGGFPLDILGVSGNIRPTYEDGNVGVMWSSGG